MTAEIFAHSFSNSTAYSLSSGKLLKIYLFKANQLNYYLKQHKSEINNMLVYRLILLDRIKNQLFVQLNQFNQTKNVKVFLKMYKPTFMIKVK